MNASTSYHQHRLDRLARRRAGLRLGWLVHATVFAAVNLLLITLSTLNGRYWAVFPFLGWGLGLALHGAIVLLVMPGGGLMERMVRRERERLGRGEER